MTATLDLEPQAKAKASSTMRAVVFYGAKKHQRIRQLSPSKKTF